MTRTMFFFTYICLPMHLQRMCTQCFNNPHHLSFACPIYVSSPSLCSSDIWKIPFLLSFAIFKWYASIVSIFQPSRMVTINLLLKFHFLNLFYVFVHHTALVDARKKLEENELFLSMWVLEIRFSGKFFYPLNHIIDYWPII